MAEKKILLLLFHPRFENSRSGKRLIKAASALNHVTIRDVYEIYPDFNIDIRAEQELLLQHDLIIWQHLLLVQLSAADETVDRPRV